MHKVGLDNPFIVERGSGIFIPQADSRFTTLAAEQIDRYYLDRLGCSYTEARAALKAVQEEISKILRGFGDLDEEGIRALVDISPAAARRAKAREFSEYFITPSRLEIEQLQQVAVEYGFKIIPGEKLSLILGGKANPVMAIERLRQYYSVNDNVRTVGLGWGNTEADLAWLEAVDMPIVIPGNRQIADRLKNKGWQIAEETEIKGWCKAIAKYCL